MEIQILIFIRTIWICLPLEVTISHSKEKEQEKKKDLQFGFTKINKEINNQTCRRECKTELLFIFNL